MPDETGQPLHVEAVHTTAESTHWSTDSNIMPEKPLALGVRAFFISLECSASVFILITNGLVLLLIYRTSVLKTDSNYYVISLVAANILAGVVSVPALILAQFTTDASGSLCRTYEYFQHLADCAEVFSLCYIAYDRFRTVASEHTVVSKKLNRRSANIRIAAIWLVSSLYAAKAPVTFNHEIYYIEDDGGLTEFGECAINHRKYGAVAIQMLLLSDFLVLFICPLAIIVTFYVLLYKRLGHSTMLSKAMLRRKKVLKVLVILVSTFFFCNIPLEILIVYINVGPGPFPESRVLELTFDFLSFLNFGLNALIYTLFNESFRTALKQVARAGFLCGNKVKPTLSTSPSPLECESYSLNRLSVKPPTTHVTMLPGSLANPGAR